MGIHGLLQFLKEASEPIHMRKYRGQTVAVDTYCWLHKGAFACAEKLAKGEPTDQYVLYCMKFVHMLLSFGVRPILVFDGCSLPSKKDVEKARREKRQANLLKGKQLLREGKLSEARECFSRCINITSIMAHAVITAARCEGVDCIVAPYEADSQLAYLTKSGFAQAIITEDSDLLAFGCKKVILKMDKFGNGLEIDQARLGMCKPLGDVFTEEKFRHMCILSGCDYLPSIHGIGLAKACKLLKMANNPDIIKVIEKIGQYLKTNTTVPEGYIEGFVRANNTFLYQLVFDPVKRKLIPLNPYGDHINPEGLSYAGPNIGDSAALQIALGNTDINTMKQIDDYNPDTSQPSPHRNHCWNNQRPNLKASHSDSIWNRNYRSNTNINIISSPVRNEKKNNCTEGKKIIISPRGLIFPCKEPTVKRPREETISDVGLLSQYSFSKTKKARKEFEDNLTQLKSSSTIPILHSLDHCVNNEGSNAQPKIRNKFATFLQRRNEECDSVSLAGTRSRFFCSTTDISTCSPKAEVEQLPQQVKTDLKDINQKNIATVENDNYEKDESLFPVPDESGLKTTLTSPLQTQQSCFSWSGSLASKISSTPQSPALLSLRKFHRNKPSLKSSAQNVKLCDRRQTNCDKSDNEIIQIRSTVSSPEMQINSDALEIEDSSSEIYCLPTQKSVGLGQGTRLKPMAPAKVSGLSKNSSKKAARSNENKPELQVTINDLWKNFGFKKTI
ncbi:exonuclease 1 [Ascaphus truei]|uniref:exonuclease 1 n=1 Tax=Ascaphus truei TaxID=8439 RepID=UPI003F5A0AF7